MNNQFAIVAALSALMKILSITYASCPSEQKTYGMSINGYSIKSFTPIGFKMCLDQCQRTARCKSIDFNSNEYSCELKSKALNETNDIVQAPYYWHVDIAYWKESYSSCNTTNCQIGEKCINDWYVPIECPEIPTIKSTVSTSTNGRKFGSVVTYQCIDGYIGTGDSNVKCSSRGSWSSTHYTCYKQVGDFILIARLKSGIGSSAYDAWFSTGTVSETDSTVEEGCTSLNYSSSCTKHYRSGLIADWDALTIVEVKVELYSLGELVANVTFNGTGTTNSNWLDKNKYISSGWVDIVTENQNFFSIQGDAPIRRRFMINRSYSGCPADSGWMVCVESTSCAWENNGDIPTFVYSPNPTYINFQSNLFLADVMGILVKLDNWP